MSTTPDLFDAKLRAPEGFAYRDDVLSPAEERACAERFAALPFAPFEFHGFVGKRRIVSYGWRYDYGAERVRPAKPIPDFLLVLRERAAAIAHLAPEMLEQALVTEYAAGAAIGWHRDKPMFEEVVALSFLSTCRLRLRRRADRGWERHRIDVRPRSAYLLRGPVRHDWEHSIPPVAALRYSVTFRRFRPDRSPRVSGN
jgi:alkylated DNA repair dioxygenase AlkB